MEMIESQIQWPVLVYEQPHLSEVLYECPNVLELGRYVEYCHSPKWTSNYWYLTDRNGKELFAVIEDLVVKELGYATDRE